MFRIPYQVYNIRIIIRDPLFIKEFLIKENFQVSFTQAKFLIVFVMGGVQIPCVSHHCFIAVFLEAKNVVPWVADRWSIVVFFK